MTMPATARRSRTLRDGPRPRKDIYPAVGFAPEVRWFFCTGYPGHVSYLGVVGFLCSLSPARRFVTLRGAILVGRNSRDNTSNR